VTTALIVAAASASLAIAGPDALVPFKDVAGAATEVGVGFVIDFGNSSKPLIGCVKVPPSDNGYEALGAFLAQEGQAPATYSQSGLLCSIGDVPSGAPAVCGNGTSAGYYYWSYWTMTDGSGSWTYASRGASVAVGTAANGEDVEGWRFQDPGPDNPSAPAPGAAPDYAAICGPPEAVVATTTPPTTGATRPTGAPVAPTTGSKTGSTTVTTATGATAAPKGATAPTTSTTTTTGAPAAAAGTHHGPTAQSLRATPTDSRQDGGSPVPLVIGSLIVAALAVAAVLGWRRRSGTP
jgi:hypothetical protein